MRLTLVSEDPELFSTCREFVAGFSGQLCSIALVAPDNNFLESDVYLWDSATGKPPEWTRREPWRHFFLIERAETKLFRKRAGGAQVLLKPLSRAALTALLESATSRLEPDTESRDSMLESLSDLNIRLQQYDQDHDNFLARAAHDFRAPLTAIGGYCGLMLGQPLGPLNESQREVLRRMQHSIRRLSRMASAMFQLSVERRAERPIELRAADLRGCLEQSLHEIALSAEEKRIALSADLGPEWQSLHFDPGQIEQVLTNLLDNACKYAPRFGAIAVRGYGFFWERRREARAAFGAERRRAASCEPNAYRVDVSDSGTPLADDDLERIFEEYISLAPSPGRTGAGLGLAICRSIVARHGGRIWAENGPSGPVFSFVLPFSRPESLRADADLVTYQEVN